MRQRTGPNREPPKVRNIGTNRMMILQVLENANGPISAREGSERSRISSSTISSSLSKYATESKRSIIEVGGFVGKVLHHPAKGGGTYEWVKLKAPSVSKSMAVESKELDKNIEGLTAYRTRLLKELDRIESTLNLLRFVRSGGSVSLRDV